MCASQQYWLHCCINCETHDTLTNIRENWDCDVKLIKFCRTLFWMVHAQFESCLIKQVTLHLSLESFIKRLELWESPRVTIHVLLLLNIVLHLIKSAPVMLFWLTTWYQSICGEGYISPKTYNQVLFNCVFSMFLLNFKPTTILHFHDSTGDNNDHVEFLFHFLTTSDNWNVHRRFLSYFILFFFTVPFFSFISIISICHHRSLSAP